MSEEEKKEHECPCCRKADAKPALIAVGVVLVLLAIAAVCATHARKVQAEKAAAAAAAAEAARIEAITKKPLLEWTEAEKAELADVYETRRQEERKTNPELWTDAEKKDEWWSYTKLKTSEVADKVSKSVSTATEKAVDAVKNIGK